ncbi:hypothetical protein B0H14DRAFT_2682049, partial [Mycena olivaceomarginata]
LHLNHESNAELATVGLTHVADIMVYGLARSRPDIHQPTVAAARRLIGLESVHRVQVMGRFRDMSVIGRLFGECTPHLQELARLKLLGSDRAMAWLVDEDCPLDILELTEVNVSGSMAAKGYVYTLLHRTRRTVTHLAFSLRAWTPSPDSRPLWRTWIRTTASARSSLQASASTNRSWASDPEDDWTQEIKFSRRPCARSMMLFAALPLPELQRVEIQIRQKTGDPPGEWFKRSASSVGGQASAPCYCVPRYQFHMNFMRSGFFLSSACLEKIYL